MNREIDIKALVSHIVKGDGIDKCRICMGDTQDGQVHLGDTVMLDGEKPVTLAELLAIITGVQVEISAMLPKKICESCSNTISSTLELIRMCRRSARKWNDVTDSLDEIAGQQTKKNIYVVVEHDEIKMFKQHVADPAQDTTDVLRNFKRMLYQRHSNTKRSESVKQLLKADYPYLMRCPECTMPFYSIARFNNHLKDIGRKVCTHCKEVFKMKDLKDHMITNDITAHSCNVCSDTFSKKNLLTKHMKLEHCRGPHICPDCKMTFKTGQHLSLHLLRHQPYYCSSCDKKFLSRSCFKGHAESCSNPKNISTKNDKYICDYCKRVYRYRTALKLHIELNHLKTWEYQCEHCGKKFPNVFRLKEHDNTHNRVDDRFVCALCDAKYSTRRGYQRHYKTHFSVFEKPMKRRGRKPNVLKALQKSLDIKDEVDEDDPVTRPENVDVIQFFNTTQEEFATEDSMVITVNTEDLAQLESLGLDQQIVILKDEQPTDDIDMEFQLRHC